ncbi:MAG: carboxypeptidase-like regulatory domain-containing protein [Myxococcales bacterium]|nr:carboxypeptidase-like regulatory domain-containing protein [Myxococcales bacterium]
MRNQVRIFGIAFCALAAAACGGDGNGSGGGVGTGGTAGTGGTGGTSGTGGTGGAETSTVSGIVRTFFSLVDPVVVPGATVRVSGANLSATTDQNGAFTIDNVPNGENFFTVEAPGHWGTVDYWDVPTETAQGFELFAVTDTDIESAEVELGRTFSTDDGIVEIFFDLAVTGASGTISPATHDPPFTIDADGFLVVQNTVIEVDGVGDLYFTSVPAGGTITADVAGPSGTACEVIESDTGTYPIVAKSITVVYADCQ